MATTVSGYTKLKDSPYPLHRVKVSAIELSSTTAVTHQGPSYEPPFRVTFVQTAVATSGDPLRFTWTNPTNKTTKVVNIVFDSAPGGDVTGAEGYLYFEFTSARASTGGISAV